jgi:hypothetical protein
MIWASLIVLIPDLALWLARVLYAHSMAVRAFWKMQATSFGEYLKAYRRAAERVKE